MRPRLVLPATFAFLAAWGLTHSAGAQELPDVDACISRLEPQTDVGFDRINARCPELVRQLERAGWTAWLPRGWNEPGNDLSAGSLKEMRALAARELAAPAASRTVGTEHLAGILAELNKTGADSKTAWSRFKKWLRSVLESPSEPSEEGWLSRTLSRVGLAQSMIELIVYISLGAVVALAGAIVANEFRAAGLFGRATRRRRAGRRPVAIAAGTWADIELVPFGDRPRLLLELIVARLSEAGYLPPPGALTVRELNLAAQLPDDDRTRLTDIALTAERVRYSGVDVPADGLERPLARGRELLERLTASAPS